MVKEGSMVVEIEGRRLPCGPNSFVIIPPGVWHASWTTSSVPVHRYWVHFDWVWLGPHGATPLMTCHPGQPVTDLYRLAPDFIPRNVIAGTISEPGEAFDLGERLHARMRRTPTSLLDCRALLLDLLIALFKREVTVSSDKQIDDSLPSRARAVLARLAITSDSLDSIEAVLEQLGYSYAHTCRLFRQAYGIAPLRYVNSIRIGRARRLLQDTQLTISEIAHQVGFRDPGYFTRVFARYTGHTPSLFRKSVSVTSLQSAQANGET
ncbi:AraC family transcriptional regulator [bacterium]|nr:AraC family transcriptional regulator [bacterium]